MSGPDPDDFDEEHLQANLRSIRAALNGEQARVRFIREAAIQLQFSTDEEGDPIVQASRAWEIARALWDAKPEDC